MAPKIPDRWTDYKPVGEKIEGTRFIAFKVPLKEHIARNVDRDIRLDRDILLKSVPNLGLIIDLTNTNRYYDPKIFQKEGVDYRKLMIPGHETPAKYLVDKFIGIVKEFMENNTDNDKLIGVHCTHGVNRTGYLICNYMISQMTIDPNEALDRFANARGHKIERNNYIDALHKLLETTNAPNDQETERIIERSRSPHRSTNTRERSIENDKRERRERSPYRSKSSNSRSRDRSLDRNRHYERSPRNRTRERDSSNYRSRHREHSREHNRDRNDLPRRHRSPDNYRSRSNTRYNRNSRSPSPYFANNRRSNNYSYRPPANDFRRNDRPYYAKPPEPQEPLRIPYNDMPYQQPPPPLPPTRLRLDYYNARPVNNKPPYNRQRYTYVRKPNHL